MVILDLIFTRLGFPQQDFGDSRTGKDIHNDVGRNLEI
jgi:hypothetical protein